MLHAIITILRPRQWVKNLFVLLPLFFGGRLLEWHMGWGPSLVAVVAFCLAASGIYCLNDIQDVGYDQQHPTKRLRPIAHGEISIGTGYKLMLGCLLLSHLVILVSAALLPHSRDRLYPLLIPLNIYIVQNLLYSLWLKHLAVVDLFVLSGGFVLRVWAGSVATGVELSHWIVLQTFLLALFLSLAKRRDDVLLYEQSGQSIRRNVRHYNVPFLDHALSIVATLTMICYIMYTVSNEVITRIGSPKLYLTAVFVLLGILRYLQITLVEQRSGDPTEILLRDRLLQGCILVWLTLFGLILYTHIL